MNAQEVVGRVPPRGVPYFRSADRQQLLLDQLHLWRGTRWAHAGTRPNEMKCGITGDCLFWVHAFKAIGALPAELDLPAYDAQEANADEMKRLRRCIEATHRAFLAWDRRSGPDPLVVITFGDVLLFKNGMAGVHCGLVVRGWPVHFVHLSRNGLVEEPLNQSHWTENLAFAYRLLEAESPIIHQPSSISDSR